MKRLHWMAIVSAIALMAGYRHDAAATGNHERGEDRRGGRRRHRGHLGGDAWTGAAIGGLAGGVAGNIRGGRQQQMGW